MANEKAMTAMDKKYQAEDDARTMTRAIEISKDKTRYNACLKQLAKQRDAVASASSMLKGMK